jgi:hypothetical protein
MYSPETGKARLGYRPSKKSLKRMVDSSAGSKSSDDFCASVVHLGRPDGIRRVAHGFDAVSVAIEHECGVVAGMIIRPQPSRPIIHPPAASAAAWKARTAARSGARKQRWAPREGSTAPSVVIVNSTPCG